jgi:uncharacterized protein (TIGR03437 family)
MQKLKLFAGSFLTALFVFPAFCLAQSISIVSGNGQVVCEACAGGPYPFALLVVQVNGPNGASVGANTAVTWTPTQQAPTTLYTNSLGQSSYAFAGISPFFGAQQSTVTAQAGAVSVVFVETVSAPDSGGGPDVVPNLETPTGYLPSLLSSTSPTPITVSVFSSSGPVAGVSLALQTGAPGPSVSCAPQAGQQTGSQPGVVLTDSTGSATCTPQFSGIGTGTYTLVVGGNFVTFGPADFTIVAGPPVAIKYVGGNNQSVNSGVKTLLPLVAEVTDVNGNPANGANVTWTVTAGTASVSNEVTSSAANGQVSAYVTPTVGPVTVTVALVGKSSAQYAFTVNVKIIANLLTEDSGNAQTAKEGAAFADPLMVTVYDNAQPVQGATVNFAVTPSGSVILSPTSAITNTQGQASVTATAGDTAGPVTVTASVTSTACPGGTCTYAFNLTVIPPGPVITAVANAAGFDNSPSAASPCSLVTIYGSGLATGLQGVVAAFIAPQTQVFGVSVQFGGVPAPILYVANVNGQESMSAQVPCNVTPNAAVPMVVTADGAASTPFPVPVTTYSPGIFQFMDTDGAMRAVLVRQDGSFITAKNPAQPGDTIRMFVTGLGQTTPPLATNEFDPLVPDASGNLVPQDLVVSANLIVGVNNGGVLIDSAKYAYGMVGVYEVEFQVPSNTALGNNAPLAIVVYQNSAKLFWGNASLIPIQ